MAIRAPDGANKAVYNLDSELNPKNSWNDTNIEFNHVRVVQQV